MSIKLLSGDAAVSAGADGEFAGFANPRAYQIGESTRNRAIGLLSDAFANRFGSEVRLAEAFSTSDFKLAAFKELDTEMLAQYEALPSVWRQYTDQTKVRDFRPKRLVSRWRNAVGLSRVPELQEYPAGDDRGSAAYAIQVAKYGRRFALSWESWLNNEAIGELEDLPGELSRQAVETETIAAVSNLLKVDASTNTASDVNTDFFKTANGNAPTALPLTRDNLKTVLDGMKVKKDPNSGRVIAAPEMVVVVPKALESTILAIITPTVVRVVDGNTTVEKANEFANLAYVIEPMLDFVNQHAKAATTWFVVPKPGSARPALWAAFLAGHETPDLRVKADTGFRIGGGDIAAVEGSFEVDDIQYRGRHVVGNQTADALFTYVSRGA